MPDANSQHKTNPPSTNSVPSSPEIEWAVLAALCQYPLQAVPLLTESQGLELFYNPVNRELAAVALLFHEKQQPIDQVSLTHFLIEAKRLDALGGAFQISQLWSTVSPIEAFAYHLEILRDKYVLRQIMIEASAIAARALVPGADPQELLSLLKTKTDSLTQKRFKGVEDFDYEGLLAFDPAKDPDTLLGQRRWLGKGYTCLWAGGSGYGKSTLEMQAALYWACGAPFFGIKPVRPLKSLIVQAENDFGDTGEQLQGVLAGIRAAGDIELNGQVSRMFQVKRVIGPTGPEFLATLCRLLDAYPADLLWIDPLFAFAGCDLIDTASVSKFLREGLIPLAVSHGTCIHVIHHIAKPSRDNDAKRNWNAADYQFLGFGSSEIQNAFRAVNVLIPVAGSEGTYRLVLSKRGSRAGALDHDEKPTTSLYLAHSLTSQILWNQVPPPEKTDRQKKPTTTTFQSKFSTDDILINMELNCAYSATDLQKLLRQDLGMSSRTFYRLWDDLKKESKIRESEPRKWCQIFS